MGTLVTLGVNVPLLPFSDAPAAPEAEEVPSDGDPAERWHHLREGGLGPGETGTGCSHQQCVQPGRDDRRHWCHQGSWLQG